MPNVRAAVAAAVLCTAVLLPAAGAEVPAGPPAWAPVESASVRPGARLTLPTGGTCTADFVFHEREAGADGVQDVYLGAAAHCFPASERPGGVDTRTFCELDFAPLGTPVPVEGALRPGVLAYHSALAMQAAGEKDRVTCAGNDFALVRLHPQDARRTNPTLPVFGGPTGLQRGASSPGQLVQAYGRSGTRGSAAALYPLRGAVTDPFLDVWHDRVHLATPGVPGDSGSPVLGPGGQALGLLNAIEVAPLTGSNLVTSLELLLAALARHGGPDVVLAEGTQPWAGPVS